MEIENIHNNLFDIDFESFKELKEIDYEILKENFKKIDKNFIKFDLQEINKKVQPLELILSLISNKSIGTLVINLHNKDSIILGKLIFKDFIFLKIEDFIDFDFDNSDKNKELKIYYSYKQLVYVSSDETVYEHLLQAKYC